MGTERSENNPNRRFIPSNEEMRGWFGNNSVLPFVGPSERRRNRKEGKRISKEMEKAEE